MACLPAFLSFLSYSIVFVVFSKDLEAVMFVHDLIKTATNSYFCNKGTLLLVVVPGHPCLAVVTGERVAFVLFFILK